jgi:hypothetical protein
MKVKNIFLKLTAIAFLGDFSLKAEIPVPQTRGLASVLNQDKQYLSPVWGAVLWNSPYVENLYRFGLPTSATVKLARSIFFVHHDQVTFDTTYLATRIATYFTPYLVGQLVALIDNYQMNLEALAKCKAELAQKRKLMLEKTPGLSGKILGNALKEQMPELTKQIQNLSTNIRHTPKEIKDLINAFEIENKEIIKEKINTYFEEKYIPKLKADLEKDPENKKLLLQLQKAKDNKDLGIENSTYLQYKDEFLNLLLKSLNETNLFIPNNTIFLLLSSLWKKANDKNEFLAYFQGLKDKHNNKEELFSNTEFIANGFDQDSFEYTEAYYENLKDAGEEEIKTNYINDIATLAFLYLGYNLFDNPIPPEIGMLDSVKYKEYAFPDCGSTSLRNFFNVILYDKDKQEFNLEYLKSFDVNPKLTSFYTKYKKPTKIITRQAHDDWAVVTSELEGVSYIKGGICEINTGIKNMLRIIEKLVGTKSFEELAEKLNANNIEVEIEYLHENKPEFNKNNRINFYIKKPNTNSFEIDWAFSPNHFQLSLPSLNKFTLIHYIVCLKNLIGLNKYNIEKQIIFLDLFAAFKANTNTIKESINKNLSTQYLYFTILIQDILETEHAMFLLRDIFDNKILYENKKLIIEFARSLYPTIPEDNQPQSTYFHTIFQYLPEIFDPTRKPFNNLSEIKMANAINFVFCSKNVSQNVIEWAKSSLEKIKSEDGISIITRSIFNLYRNLYTNDSLTQFVEKNIDNIQSEEIKTNIICSILMYFNQLTPTNEPFSRFILEWIKNNITTIKDDYTIDCIIRYILEGNIQDPELIKWAEEKYSRSEIFEEDEEDSAIINAIFKNYRSNKILMREAKKHLHGLDINETWKTQIIKTILENITDPEITKWAKDQTYTIQNNFQKDDLIQFILAKDTQDAFYTKWVKETLPNIENNFFANNIIKIILEKYSQDADLTGWVKNYISNNVVDEHEASIISSILEKHSQDPILMKWAIDNIMHLENNQVIEIIPVILEKHSQDPYLINKAINAIVNLETQELQDLNKALVITKQIIGKISQQSKKTRAIDTHLRRLNQKTQELEAEIQRREPAEAAPAILGFMSKVKQFWQKLTFKKQNPTIIKAA